MQSNPVRRGVGYAGRIYGQRQCADCPAQFISNSSGQKRCSDCQGAHERKLGRERQARKRKATFVPKQCLGCGAELPSYQGMHSKRCEPCRETYWIEHTRKRNKARTESGARRVYDERYRASNGETIRANNRKYKAAHPETDEAASARRRQRMAHGMDQLDRALSAAYRQAIRNDLCFYCGAPPAPDDETDHFFPLVKHGTDHWFNLVRTCQRCNRGPGGKHQVCGTAFMLTGCVPWRPLLPAPTSSSLMTAGPALPVLPPLPGVQMTMF